MRCCWRKPRRCCTPSGAAEPEKAKEQATLRYRVSTGRRLWAAAAGLVLIAVAGCVKLPPVSAVTSPPIPGGDARVWFYRIYDPSESLGRPNIYMNGAPIGIAELGGAFYRNVPAGWYYITVDTWGRDLYQFYYGPVVPGQTQCVEIQSLCSWVESGYGFDLGRDTFYVAIIPPARAVPMIARSDFDGGGV
jgi:hypothetical protein